MALQGADATVRDALTRSRDCFLAVSTPRGPHVTPHVFTASGGQLWFTTSRNARKVRALKADPRAAALVTGDDFALVVRGTVRILDALDPTSMVRGAFDVVRSLRAAPRLISRTLDQLLGYGLDAADLPLDWLPVNRVLFTLRPRAALMLDNDWRAIHRTGSWPYPGPLPDSDKRSTRADSTPHTDVGAMAAQTPEGPIAAPARYASSTRTLSAPAAALGGLTGRGLAFTAHRSDGIRPTDKHGYLLRGTGGVIEVEHAIARLTMDARTETTWSGFASRTRRIGDRG